MAHSVRRLSPWVTGAKAERSQQKCMVEQGVTAFGGWEAKENKRAGEEGARTTHGRYQRLCLRDAAGPPLFLRHFLIQTVEMSQSMVTVHSSQLDSHTHHLKPYLISR